MIARLGFFLTNDLHVTLKLPPHKLYCGLLLAAFWLVGGCAASPAEKTKAKVPLESDSFLKLVQQQPIIADQAIFDGDAFPKIDFLNKDLITAALGAYNLDIRFFDAACNEVSKPTSSGRYGAWVEIHFPDGANDTRHLTLFKTAVPYHPAKDPYHFTVQFPAAFGLSKELIEREQWNSDTFIGGLVKDASRNSESYAVFLAAMHDIEADPARWHGFSCWRIDDAWWAGVEKKIGLPQDYQHLVHTPDDYDKKPGEKWPLILFLHGTGERGDDLSKVKNKGPMGYLAQGHALPFIVVTPQCPARQQWNPERLVRLIDQIEATYRVDSRRIYVTGLSMGGYGTFDLAACYPQKFAAIAPLSAGEDPDIADRLKTVPTWIFHGTDDEVVPARYSVAVTDRMKEIGADVKLTLYPRVGHEKWDQTYADPALYAWFLLHSRE